MVKLSIKLIVLLSTIFTWLRSPIPNCHSDNYPADFTFLNSPRTMSSKSITTDTISKSLGRADKQVSLSIIPCPDVGADIVFRTHAFEQLMKQLDDHVDRFDFSEISSFVLSTIPGASETAAAQASSVGLSIRKSLFQVSNIVGLVGFYDDKWKPIPGDKLNVPVTNRAANITFVGLEVSITASKFFPKSIPTDADA